MVESRSELGVVLKRDCDIAACARRLASRGRGVLEDLRGAEDARVKLLRVADTTRERRRAVREDPTIEGVYPVYRFAGMPEPVIGTRQLLAKLRPGLTEQERTALFARYRVELVQQADGFHGVYLLKPSDSEQSELLVAEVLSEDERVVWAQPNLRRPVKRRQVTANDEFFGLQWHLHNTGQLGGTPDADIDAPDAWINSEGQGVLIGIFDDACDVEHEDLAGNYIGVGHDPTLPSTDSGFRDPRPKQIGDRHGTAVIGYAVARANSVGGRGVAYLANFTCSRGLGNALTDFDVASVFTFARQQDVDVHINSWGIDGPNSAVIEDAIRTAFREGRPQEGEDLPDLGMVIVFASGNEFQENPVGFDFSTMEEVIGVGATDDLDFRAAFSNWGRNVDVLAPGGSADDLRPGLLTTDVEDVPGRVDNGFNVGGDFGPDAEGKYYGDFIGTSAACPVVGGVAALVLSVNPLLTANDVRLILEHTADQVSPNDAQYDGLTGRSVQYGFGRVNANAAVTAAQETLVNGGLTWPDRPFDVNVSAGSIEWRSGVGTNEFLIVESAGPFDFRPEDSKCYDSRQAGCSLLPITPLPAGVEVVDVVACTGGCDLGELLSVSVSGGTAKFFGLYARNMLGRYAFGVGIDSSGNIENEGRALTGATDSGDPGTPPPTPIGQIGPKVTISASPLNGSSPLTVSFRGNAVSSVAIDEARTLWDFDIESQDDRPATTRTASFTYEVPPGQVRTFTARLSMFDMDGRVGTATVMIRVEGQADPNAGAIGDSNLKIVVGVPGTIGLDVDTGRSPFQVELSIDVSVLNGTLQSISWDLGDGSRANTLIVPHTYTNETDQDLVLPIVVTVTTVTSGGATLSTGATRLITIRPGTGSSGPVEPPDFGPQPGSGSSGICGAMGLLPLLLCASGLLWFKRS